MPARRNRQLAEKEGKPGVLTTTCPPKRQRRRRRRGRVECGSSETHLHIYLLISIYYTPWQFYKFIKNENKILDH